MIVERVPGKVQEKFKGVAGGASIYSFPRPCSVNLTRCEISNSILLDGPSIFKEGKKQSDFQPLMN